MVGGARRLLSESFLVLEGARLLRDIGLYCIFTNFYLLSTLFPHVNSIFKSFPLYPFCVRGAHNSKWINPFRSTNNPSSYSKQK